MENKIDNFCAITEISNREFHLCRTAIFSFISTNKWFNGYLILLNIDGEEITDHNINILKLTYEKFNIISPDDSKILQKLRKKKNVNKRSSFLYLQAFNIKYKGNIFFSKSSLFMNEISSILSNKELNVPIKSPIFPELNPTGSEDLNTNLMFIPKKYISNKRYNDILNIVSSSEIYKNESESNVLKKYIKQYSIDVKLCSNTLSVNSSFFDNSKYSNFIRYHKAIGSLNMDTASASGTFNFKRIHNYWKQYNHNLVNGLTKSVPTKINTKNIKIARKKYKHKINKSHSLKNTFSDKLAIYTTSDENYIEHAIVAFQTFREINPHLNLDFFIISKELSHHKLELLDRNSISHIELDLSGVFKIEENWPYPSECFWLFKGPDLLNNLGYKYSMYIDSDVQCNQPMDLSWLYSLDLIAGAERGASLIKFLSHVENIHKITKGFNIDRSNIQDIPSVNTGVLFFNNAEYSRLNFYQKAIDAFTLSKELGIPRKGDDSLMCLLMSIYYEYSYKTLPSSWNDYKFYHKNPGKSVNHFNSIIIHHSRHKPWNKRDTRFYKNQFNTLLVSRWCEMSKKLKLDGKL